MAERCTCALGADECDNGFGVFLPLQDGGSCAVRPCQRPAPSRRQPTDNRRVHWDPCGVGGTLPPSSADERMRHDYPILQQFHTKHALGAIAAPSCLCCGQQTHTITRPIAVQHMELPAIVVCKQCKDAACGVDLPDGAKR